MGKILDFNRLARGAAKEKGLSKVIETKAATLLDGFNALSLLAQQQTNARLAFKILRTMKALASHLDKIEADRIALCQKYGTLPEGEKNYIFEPDQRALFDREIEELNNRDVTVNAEKFTLDEIAGLQINAIAMSALTFLLDQPEEMEEPKQEAEESPEVLPAPPAEPVLTTDGASA